MNQEQTKRLLTDLFAADFATDGADDGAPCHANQDDIAAYVEAELDGVDVAVRYPVLHAQLAECATCREAFTELKMLLEMARAGTFVEPPAAPQFDLSYLTAAPTSVPIEASASTAEDAVHAETTIDHITWRVAALGQLIVTLSEDFIQSLQPVTLQPSFLKSTTGDLFAVTAPAIADDLVVTIAARPMRREPEHCTITVGAEIPSRGGWPELSGTAVTLSIDGETMETRHTDAFGKVVFEGIARDALGQVTIAVAVELS